MADLLYSDAYSVMANTSILWPQMDGKRVFLAGCSGFVGQWLMETFNFARHGLGVDVHMTGMSRRPVRSETQYIDFVQGDIRDFEFPKGRYDYLIHAAGGYGGDTFQTAVHGTERLLEFARHAGVQRILYLSSGAIYNLQPHEEKHAYGVGKMAAEMLCTLSGIDTRIARMFSFIGPFMDFDKYAAGKFIKDGCTKGKVTVKGGRNVRRGYLYAAEMVASLWMILLYPKADRVYNVGSSEGITMRDLADVVADVCGVPVEEEAGEYPDSDYVMTWEQKPQVPLRDAIEKTVAWYKEVHS